jgi:hypothetical protein
MLADQAFDRGPFHRPSGRNKLDHHLALDDVEACLRRDGLQRNQERGPGRPGVRCLPVMHGHRRSLVLDPGLWHHRGRRLGPRRDSGHQLGRVVLEPVQANVLQVRDLEQRRHLLRAAAGHDRDEPVAPGEVDERLAGPVDGACVLGTRDDLGERAVEVQDDARGAGPLAQGVEVRRFERNSRCPGRSRAERPGRCRRSRV